MSWFMIFKIRDEGGSMKKVWAISLVLVCFLNFFSGGTVLLLKAESDSEFQPYPIPEGFRHYGPSLLSAFMALVERRLVTVRESLRTMVVTEEVKSGDWEKMKGLFAALQGNDPGLIYWYVKPDGSYWTSEAGKTGKNLSDRPYFPGLMRGEEVMGPLVVSKSTGRPSVIAAVPIKEEDNIAAGVGASVFLDNLNYEVKKAIDFPENVIWFALAPDGRSPLVHIKELIMNSPLEQDSPTLQAATREMLKKESGMVTYEFLGNIRYVIYKTSPLTGWRFVVGIVLGQAKWKL